MMEHTPETNSIPIITDPVIVVHCAHLSKYGLSVSYQLKDEAKDYSSTLCVYLATLQE